MRRTLPLIILLALLAGCAGRQAAVPPTAAPEATQAPAATTAATAAPEAATAAPEAGTDSFDAAAVQAAIQATVDDYARAYSTGDAELLRSTVDQSNAPFRRLVQERFNISQESAIAGGAFELEVVEVQPRELGFVQAAVERDGWLRYDWLFREVDGRWLLSEPSEKQLGERIEIESEHFVFHTYHWADDVNGKLVEMMERAREQVIEALGEGPDGQYNVYIRPIFGFTPPASAGAVAWYTSAARPRGDRMDVYAPGSYVFGGYVAEDGWEADLYSTLVHEYTHLVNQRSFMPTAEMRDWMYEGLAEYVAESPRAGEVSAAVQAGRIIPIIDTSGSVNPQDLDHLYILERDRSLAYGLSYALVAYIVEEHGGLDTLWALARAMNETPGTGVARYDGAMREVLGVGYEQFDADWRAWLEANY